MGNVVLRWLGKRTAAYLTEDIAGHEPSTPPDYTSLERSIQPGHVLLIEGNTRISSIIKYLTQFDVVALGHVCRCHRRIRDRRRGSARAH
jgi:hypothetical protein